jgi:hypothetical protein
VLGSDIAVSTDNRGERGSLDIEVGTLIMSAGVFSADTLSSGDAGEVRIKATGLVRCTACLISSSTFGSGRGGTVTVEANKLEVTADGVIRASTSGSGDGGQVPIKAAELTIDFGLIASEAFEEDATGNAGVVIVEAGNLAVRDGFIATFNGGAGNAGATMVTADRVNLIGGQITSAVFGTGRGGDVIVTAHDGLVISGRSTIFSNGLQPTPSGIFASSDSDNAGRGGTVTITAPVITIADGGEISAASVGADQAGSVTINAEKFQMNNARISTESKTGGGRIVIRGSRVMALRDSQILTTIGQAGGSLEIEADIVVLDSSDILLTSEQPAFLPTVAHLLRSPDSQIILNSAPFDLSEIQDTIEVKVAPAAVLPTPPLRERCSSRRDIGASSLTGAGRGGLPPSPDGPLGASYVVAGASAAGREARSVGDGGDAEPAPTAAVAATAASADARRDELTARFPSSARCRGAF